MAPQKVGAFWGLSSALRTSLVTTARHRLKASLEQARTEKEKHDEEKLARREEAVQRQLDATIDAYAAALELFDMWRAQRVESHAALDAALRCMSPAQQLAELRRQIEMRTVGCGMLQFSVKWGFFADERAHTIDLLKRMLLEDILPHERALKRLRQLPTEAAPPQTKVRVLPSAPLTLAVTLTLTPTLTLGARAQGARHR